jgi:hypothetical protein
VKAIGVVPKGYFVWSQFCIAYTRKSKAANVWPDGLTVFHDIGSVGPDIIRATTREVTSWNCLPSSFKAGKLCN